MTGPVDRTEILLRAREFIRAHGQVPDTGDLSGNPGEAAWQLLEQVLDIAVAPAGTSAAASEARIQEILRKYHSGGGGDAS